MTISDAARTRMRTVGIRVLTVSVAAVLVVTGGVTVPGATADPAPDEPGVFYSSVEYAPGWIESISGPIYPILLGSATASPATYAPGSTVTVTVTVQYPIDHCEGTFGNGDPRSRDAGTEHVSINWNGAELVSYGPTEDDRFYVYHSTGNAEWVIPISIGPADEYIQNGETFTASFIAPDSDELPVVSLQAKKLQADACTSTLGHGDITLHGGGLPFGVGFDPVAAFTFAPSPDDPLEIAFHNASTDPQDDPDDLTYRWDFNDGETSTEQHPTHVYSSPGTYTVTLRVTNSFGGITETSRTVVIEGGLVVNSTGDAPATDAAATGCDTGSTVGDAPECTLRAALETVTNDGGGEITFDIDAGGVPTITVGADPLPAVPGDTTIDGTSQAAGQVAIDGAGTETLLSLTGPGTTVEGLVLDNASTAISVDGGEGAVITNNVIGADATGMTPGSVDDGVTVTSGNNVVVSENVIAAGNGLIAANVAAGAQFIDNAVGVQKGGGAALGETSFGILAVGPDAVVRGNTVHASLIGIGIVSAQAAGAEVRGNRIGVAGAADVVLDGNGQGVRVDGTPDVVVAENVISSPRDDVNGDIGAVVVTGGQQGGEEVSGDRIRLVFFNHNGTELDSPVTATNVTITDNVIGDSAVTGGDDVSGAKTGILAWDEPSNVTVHDNVIAGPERGVEIYGGSGHSVLGNRIGVDTSDAPHPVESVGVLLDGATNSAVGAAGQGNAIHTALLGISLTGGSTEGLVVANEVTASGDEDTTCIAIGGDSDNVAVQENTVIDCAQGVAILDAIGGSAERNVVQDATVGLLIEGDSTTASTNIVLGATLQAFIVGAEDVTLEDNLIGTTSRNGEILPFDGGGISFLEGSGTVRNNVIVGAGGSGIAVNTTDVVTLRGNRLEDIGQRPIVAPNGPDEPTIDAVVQTTGPDGSTRTTLVVSGLPDGDAGELEVFANDDCDPDGEAAKVLGVVKTKKVDRTTMIVQLIDRDDDNFTATYTDTTGTTSELSECESITDYPDSDGDGSVDPIDDLGGGAGDPTRGVVITDDAQILQVSTDAGQLTGLAAVDDPAPGGHPGVDLPYGTVTFTVEGLEPGASANVTFLVIDGDAMQPGSTYWKFAPPSPAAAPSWFDFSFDENTGLGAQTLDPVDLPGLGFRRPLQVSLRDGALGDTDGFPNGTIVDPGAIAGPTGTDPGDPGNDPATTGPVDEEDPSTTGGGPDDESVQTPEVPAGASDRPEPPRGSLPRTGAPLLALTMLGAAFLFMGSACWRTALTRRRRRRHWTAP